MASIGSSLSMPCPICQRKLQVPIDTDWTTPNLLTVTMDRVYINQHLLTHTHWDGEPIAA